MRRALAVTISSAFLASSLIGLSTTSATAVSNPVLPTQFGMHVPAIAEGVDPGVSYGSIRIWDSGVTWGQVQQAKNKFWWDGLDRAIGNANTQKVSILYVLGSTPKWAATNVKQGNYPNKGAASMPKIKDWKNWVKAVVNRYGESIDSYQIWNEANLTDFWQGTPKQMANLTKTASKIIRQGDPTAKIVSASTTVRLTPAYQKFFPAYLKELKKANWPVDAIAIHSYPDGRGTPATRATLIEVVNTQLKKSKVPANKELWDTEVNYGIKGPDKIKGQTVSGDVAASWVAQTYLDNLRLGVDRSYWYFWAPDTARIGIAMQDGTTGAIGYQSAFNWMNESYYSCSSGALNTCNFGDNDNVDVVVWASKGAQAYTVPSNASVSCNALNQCSAVTPGQSIAIGHMPTWFGTTVTQN